MTVEPVTTVILVRHADRDKPAPGTPQNPDPPLNAKGKARAKTLAQMLSTAVVQAVYTSPFQRTAQTAQPFLATRPTLSAVSKGTAAELKKHILDNNAGKVVLVVGHSNTVPELIKLLDGPVLPEINDCEFDNLFVLVRYSAAKVAVMKFKYGEPTAAPC